MNEAKVRGFRTGYNGYNPIRHPIGSPPYKLTEREKRQNWIEGWNLGRKLAAEHWEIMETEAAKLINEPYLPKD